MKVAILGGGVAGASCAIALARQGHRVDVYERRPSLEPLGAGLVLWPNATAVLAALGLLDRVARHAGRPSAMRRLSFRGAADLGALDIATVDAAAALGQPSLSVLRTDLQSAFFGAMADAGVAVHFGHAVTDIVDAGDDQAMARLDNGATVDADLIIGADGRMASAARRYVAPQAQPVYQGFLNWVGISRGRRAAPAPMEIRDYWGVGQRFGIVPVQGDTIYWAAGRAHPTGEYANDQGPPQADLLRQYADWPAEVRDAIAGADPGSLRRIAVHDIDPLQAWHRRNVVLVGDAAHAALPTSGQGACQAIEDAWHLSQCLAAAAPSDLEQAFAAFTARRLGKTTQIAMAGRALAKSLFHTDAGFCERRDRESALADHGAAAGNMGRFWAEGLQELGKDVAGE